jgi:hypothetical protein
VAGRHRKPRGAGLPPILSAFLCVAALGTTLVLVQPDPVPDDVPILPEPAPAARTPAPTTTRPVPTTPPAATTVAAPMIMVIPAPTTTTPPPVTTTTVAPKPKPAPTTEAPVPKPPPVAKARPADDAPASGKCSGLGVAANVRHACNVIVAAVPGIPTIGGRAARPGNPTSCHPRGLALDLMTYDDRALGDRIYAFVMAHRGELGITTVLWRVADHFDHVHLSLLPCKN